MKKESEVTDGMDMALIVIDKVNKILDFARAKNPLIYIQNRKLHKIKGDIMGISGAQIEIERHFTTHNRHLSAYYFLSIFRMFAKTSLEEKKVKNL